VELNNLMYVAALLACPIGMGLMMWMMSKNMGGQKEQSMGNGPMVTDSTNERLARLRLHKQAVEDEINELVQLVKLETQRDALQHDDPQTARAKLAHLSDIERVTATD
jgi:hypothetical protein